MADYKSTTEEGKCIFCEIAQGKMQPLGGGKFFEDERYMAWLSPFPNTEGFAVVIPKKHYASDVLAMPDPELKEFVIISKKISNMLIKHFADVGRVGLIMEGTGIDHAHIKLVPMHGTEHMKKGEWRQYLGGNNSFFEQYPGWICSNDGPRANDEEIKKLAEELRKIKN